MNLKLTAYLSGGKNMKLNNRKT